MKKQTSDVKYEEHSCLEKVPLMADQNPCLIPAPPILYTVRLQTGIWLQTETHIKVGSINLIEYVCEEYSL